MRELFDQFFSIFFLVTTTTEAPKTEIEIRFTKEELSPKQITELSIALSTIGNEIEKKTERWFELSMDMD